MRSSEESTGRWVERERKTQEDRKKCAICIELPLRTLGHRQMRVPPLTAKTNGTGAANIVYVHSFAMIVNLMSICHFQPNRRIGNTDRLTLKVYATWLALFGTLHMLEVYLHPLSLCNRRKVDQMHVTRILHQSTFGSSKKKVLAGCHEWPFRSVVHMLCLQCAFRSQLSCSKSDSPPSFALFRNLLETPCSAP